MSGIQWFPSDTGLFITSSLDHFVRVWDTNEMSQACAFDLQQPVYAVALSLTATLHNLIAGKSFKCVLDEFRLFIVRLGKDHACFDRT